MDEVRLGAVHVLFYDTRVSPLVFVFFFQAEDGIRDLTVTGVQTCALPISFSPARMWIGGLRSLNKPYLHLHTQFNEELPWPTIDMNFMNLNQSAHGDREYGFIGARMRLPRKVVVGSWRDASIHSEIAVWARAACAWHDAQHLKIARLGDNMRNVAVTEGDKVDAQIRLRYSVNG